MTQVAVIIPVHNNWPLTRDCLTSLAACTDAAIRVIVADNGSTDDTSACPHLGRTLFGDRFAFVRFDTNRNFGPACNAAAATAEEDLLLFLNNDTLLSPGWLPPLVHALESDARLAAVGPLLLYPDGRVQHLGIAFWPGGGGVSHLYRNIPGGHALAEKTRRFQALTAAALLLRREDFLAVGGFDEGYINGFEDVDLGLQLTANGRWMSCVPQSRVTHLESRTPRRKDHDAANSARLSARWSLPRCGDLPELIQADGYRLRVLPDLELLLDVPPERAQELLRRMGTRRDARTCLALLPDLLDEEPFWVQGHALLADVVEQAGAWDLAEQVLNHYFALAFAPAPEDYARLLRIRTALGKDTARATAMLHQQRAAIDGARARLPGLVHTLLASGKAGHAALIPLYEQAAAHAERTEA